MPKCIYCHLKRGKRSCPALNGLICDACCGEHRGQTIPCPQDCPYFAPHEAYQRKRLGPVFLQDRRPLYRDLESRQGKIAVRLLYLLDILTYRYFHPKSEVLDWEILSGLEHARKSLGPIMVPAAGPSAFAEGLLREIQQFCRESEVSAELAVEVLDRGIEFCKVFSGNDLRANRYWKGLAGFLEQYEPSLVGQLRQEASSPQKIIVPPGSG